MVRCKYAESQRAVLENRVLKRLLAEHRIPWQQAVAAEQHRMKMAEVFQNFSGSAGFIKVMTQPGILQIFRDYCDIDKPIKCTCRCVRDAEYDPTPLSTRMLVLFDTRSEVYNPSTNAWTPYCRTLGWSFHSDYEVALCDGMLYAVGCERGVFSARCLDLSDWRGWKNIKAPQFAEHDEGFCMIAHNGVVYLIGGEYSGIQTDIVQAYQKKSDYWEPRAFLRHRRSYSAAVSAERYLYVLGGYYGSKSARRSFMSSCERYDAVADRWDYIADMSIGRMGCGASYCKGFIYAAGGEAYCRSIRDGKPSDSFERYSIKDDSWEQLLDLPFPYAHAISASLEGQIYVFGVRLGAASTNGDCYDIAKACWRPTMCMRCKNDNMVNGVFTVRRKWRNTDSACSAGHPYISAQDID